MGTLAAGIKEIFATAKTIGSNVMLCGNDGTPDGHMTMANLASVLGVSQYSSISDFNNATTKGVFTSWGNPANAPINDTRLWVVRVERYVQNASYGISQMAYCADDNKMFYRISNISTTWGDWKEISTDMPTFYKNYSDLSSLANALGVSALNNSSLFRIISGSVPSNQTVDVSCGNGLLFVGVFSGGTLYWPNYWSTEVQIIAGTTNTQYTVTKSAESRVVHITAPSNYDVSYAYIGFTS